MLISSIFFFFQAEDGIRDVAVTGVQTCALPISFSPAKATGRRRPAAEPSLSLAATLRVPRERVCQSANSRLAPQLCTLQPFDPGSSDQMRQSKAVPSSPAGPDDAGIFVDDQNFRGTRRAATKLDRKSTRLNSSHGYISYAVFCLKKKKKHD